MKPLDAERLELLAEVDALVARLRRWAEGAPDWGPAETCRAMVGRLADRAEKLAVRIEAPLVVATLGGTGTGKSALVNALLGEEVVPTGRQRPTTTRPTLVCRPDLSPEMLGIDPASVEVVHRELPVLDDLVLVDCPDPDTTEGERADDGGPQAPGGGPQPRVGKAQRYGGDPQQPGGEAQSRFGRAQSRPAATNLAKLRRILPHCDVLLVTTTQQKYRSARVADELAAAAAGARLVFVQTHADVDDDVREDWAAVLGEQYATGHLFLVDSLAALGDAQAGIEPRGEFGRLVGLLTRELSGTAAARIRRAGFLDLADATLARCRATLDEAAPPVEKLLTAIEEQRAGLAARLAAETREELLANRRAWEGRLLAQSASRWGLSPFSLLLRVYQGLGGLLAGSLLYRMRTPAQMALWGAVQGARQWRRTRQSRRADQATARAVAGCWDETSLRKAAVVLEGYALDAGLTRSAASPGTVADEAEAAGERFVARAAAGLESLVARLARRHTGWLTRCCYELLFLAMLGFLLYRLGKNFFYDSFLAPKPVDVYGLDFYLAAGFWLLVWCLLLVWLFTGRLRRGLRREIDQLAQSWNTPDAAAGLFARLEDAAQSARRFRQERDLLHDHVEALRRDLATPEEPLGRRR